MDAQQLDGLQGPLAAALATAWTNAAQPCDPKVLDLAQAYDRGEQHLFTAEQKKLALHALRTALPVYTAAAASRKEDRSQDAAGSSCSDEAVQADEERCRAEAQAELVREEIQRLERALHVDPNLGYCCLNTELRKRKPSCYTNRTCIQKTFREKGLVYVSALALQNAQDLLRILQWNEEHGIRLFRVSSELVPWFSEYKLDALPAWKEIAAALKDAGDYARLKKHRLTMHPGPHVVLGAVEDKLGASSAYELEQHAALFDAMGFAPSFENKINIHVRGVYLTAKKPTAADRTAAKRAVMDRFAQRWRTLSDSVTVENDDTPNAYCVDDLAYLHGLIGIPIVYDAHHQKFCNGAMSAQEAFAFATGTWPAGVRPIVHWSESQSGRKPLAHSDWICGPVSFFAREADVDCMLEVKEKEQALLKYRDRQ